MLVNPVNADELPGLLSEKDFIEFDAKQAELGQLLFYDKILSGNRNISCGTCHHHDFGSSDGLSLGIGEGGSGVGDQRIDGLGDNRIQKRIPRNSPGLWNLGAKQIEVLFHDGRLSRSDDYGNGIDSPAEEWLPTGFNSLLAAQAAFPMTSRFEMAGDPAENPMARAAFDRIDHVWAIVEKRIRAIPEYKRLFAEAFVHIGDGAEIRIVDIGNALAAFIGTEWRSFDSPFDQYLAGDKKALTKKQLAGLELFYGDAGCHQCHSGALFTDQSFHALAIPPLGPGRTRLHDPIPRDVGRMGESDRLEDAYRFRTPSLRNAELTPPYGHNGSYPTLEAIIRHHLNPLDALDHWQVEQASLPVASALKIDDLVIWQDSREMERFRRKVDIDVAALKNDQIEALVAFIHALTGVSRNERPLGIPAKVPSGLAVDRGEPSN